MQWLCWERHVVLQQRRSYDWIELHVSEVKNWIQNIFFLSTPLKMLSRVDSTLLFNVKDMKRSSCSKERNKGLKMGQQGKLQIASFHELHQTNLASVASLSSCSNAHWWSCGDCRTSRARRSSLFSILITSKSFKKQFVVSYKTFKEQFKEADELNGSWLLPSSTLWIIENSS